MLSAVLFCCGVSKKGVTIQKLQIRWQSAYLRLRLKRMSEFRVHPLTQKLELKGGKDQLLMFLSGKAGSGKSYVIKNVLTFIRIFPNKCNIPFDSDIAKVTAFTGSTAAQLKILGATRLHRAAKLRS